MPVQHACLQVEVETLSPNSLIPTCCLQSICPPLTTRSALYGGTASMTQAVISV